MRNLLFSVHKWLGLNLLILMGYLFLTGAFLSIAPDLDLFLNPEIAADTPGPDRATPGEIFDALHTQEPDFRPLHIMLSPNAGQGDMINGYLIGRGSVFAWTDPDSTELLDIGGSWPVTKVLNELHTKMMVPSGLVELFLSATSIFLFLLIVTGLITYRRFWRGFLRKPQATATTRVRWGAWHRLFALWAVPFLLLQAVTSIYFFSDGLGMVDKPQWPQTEQREHILPDGFSGADIDRFIAIVSDANPSFVATGALIPNNARMPVVIQGRTDASNLLGADEFYLHPVTSEIIGERRSGQARTLGGFDKFIRDLHAGRLFGQVNSYLWLALTFLSIALMWAGAKVNAARTSTPGSETAPIGAAIRSMAIFRWFYLLGAIGLVAVTIWRIAF